MTRHYAAFKEALKESARNGEPELCTVCNLHFHEINVHMRNHGVARVQVCPECGEDMTGKFKKVFDLHVAKHSPPSFKVMQGLGRS